MAAAAAELEFERAARLRDDIGALRRAMEKQAVVLGDGTDADVVAFAEDALEAAVQVFHVRGGRVRGQRGWVVDKVEDVTTGDLVEQFCLQVYGGDDARPTRPAGDPGAGAAAGRARCSSSWLRELRGARVTLRVPQRGDKRALLETVARNAAAGLPAAQAQAGQRPDRPVAGAGRARRTRSGWTPRRCGSSASTSRTCRAPTWSPRMVVFEDGLPRKSRVPPVRHPRHRDAPSTREAGDAVGQAATVPSGSARPCAAGWPATWTSGSTPARRPTTPRTTRATRPRPAAAEPGRPGDRPAAQVRLPAEPAGRRRRRPAGRRGRGRAGRARHRRRRAVRAGQAAGGGLAARRGRAGDPAAHVRGAVPAAAGAGRGAPVRDHLPPAEAVQGDDDLGAGRRAGAGRDPAEGAADPVRLAEAAPRGRPSRTSWPFRASAGGPPRRSPPRCTGRTPSRVRRWTRSPGRCSMAELRGLEVVVVSGLSGAGRSTAAKCLEDLGWYVVDNLPPALIAAMVDLGSHTSGEVTRIAVVVDVRSRAFSADLRSVIGELDERGYRPRVLFLEAPTRCWSAGSRATGGPTRCRAAAGWSTASPPSGSCCRDLHAVADLVVDTSRLSVHDLRRQIERRVQRGGAAGAAGDGAVVRLQVRPAAGRRPRRGRALPAQPALDPGAAPAHRPGPGRPRLRAVAGGRRPSSSTSTPSCCAWSAPATSGRASGT